MEISNENKKNNGQFLNKITQQEEGQLFKHYMKKF
jgi:hypothetical protein